MVAMSKIDDMIVGLCLEKGEQIDAILLSVFLYMEA